MTTAAPPLYAADGFGPPGVADTGWLAGAGGIQLRTALFPASQARGSVVLNTGRTEFIEKYYEVIGELLARRFTVLTHDWRGQGLSTRLLPDEPLKGHARGAGPFLDDLDLILAHYGPELPKPWIVMGHSMGGALTLLHLLERKAPFFAAVLSSPMTGVNLHDHRPLLVNLSINARRLFGRLTDYVETPTTLPWNDVFAGNSVTRNQARFMQTLGAPTWGWLDFALSAASTIQNHPAAANLGIPLRVVAAGAEKLADTPATKAFCAKARGAECIVADGALHEILMEEEPTRALFWNTFDEVANAVSHP